MTSILHTDHCTQLCNVIDPDCAMPSRLEASEIEDQNRGFRSRAADHDHIILRPFLITEIVVAIVGNSFHNSGFAGPATAHRTGKINVDAGVQQGVQDGAACATVIVRPLR